MKRVRASIALALLALLAACGDSTAPTTSSSFNADVRGTTNERITGTGTASFGDWLRQSALQITLPNGTTFSGIAPTPAEAETVWKAVDELRSQLAKRDTRWKRLLAAVSLRSLGYRGRRNGKGRER